MIQMGTENNKIGGSSIELVVLGLLAALIVVLAVPLLGGIDTPAPEDESAVVEVSE